LVSSFVAMSAVPATADITERDWHRLCRGNNRGNTTPISSLPRYYLPSPLPAALVCRGSGRLLYRPRRQRSGARLCLFGGGAGPISPRPIPSYRRMSARSR
jgi:hypothetical protein